MLTVLIRGWSGHERILQTKEVRSEPPSEFRKGGFRYFIDREDGTCEEVDGEYSSVIYVMNDAGRTVATYYFSRPPQAVEATREAA